MSITNHQLANGNIMRWVRRHHRWREQELLDVPQVNVFQHLGYLRKNGLVEFTSVQTWKVYRLRVSEVSCRGPACPVGAAGAALDYPREGRKALSDIALHVASYPGQINDKNKLTVMKDFQ